MKHFTVRAQSPGYRRIAKAAPGEWAAPVCAADLWEFAMFKSLNRIRAAFAQASKRRRTTRELNELPTEIKKDIGWPDRAEPDEIRLPF
ncbi:DUF1127 domain-containing protein [Mesorhizobium hawassense]|uniref:DUF1127 domain-containing protein n=1 Tax=Mesorhizobium hawassense TaxID=1209954 RepID=UPI0011BF1214|nr:hypothetical protein [Mesorhizobium hawassense]